MNLKGKFINRSISGMALVSPGMLLILIILVFPLFYTLYISVHEFNYLKLGDFIWFRNYIKLFSNPEIMQSIIRTIFLSVAGLALSLTFGLLLALWVNARRGIYAYIIQMVALVPWVTSVIVGTLLWKWMLDDDLGLLNYLLNLLGLRPINFFSNANIAMATLIFVVSWRTVGYSMVMILAGLKGIQLDIIEAGKVDGANQWQLLRYIKIPIIKTPLIISSIVLILSNFNNVTVPLVLTGGGPAGATNVVSLELYRLGFSYSIFGMASALSFIVFIINIIFITVYMRLVKYDV